MFINPTLGYPSNANVSAARAPQTLYSTKSFEGANANTPASADAFSGGLQAAPDLNSALGMLIGQLVQLLSTVVSNLSPNAATQGSANAPDSSAGGNPSAATQSSANAPDSSAGGYSSAATQGSANAPDSSAGGYSSAATQGSANAPDSSAAGYPSGGPAPQADGASQGYQAQPQNSESQAKDYGASKNYGAPAKPKDKAKSAAKDKTKPTNKDKAKPTTSENKGASSKGSGNVDTYKVDGLGKNKQITRDAAIKDGATPEQVAALLAIQNIETEKGDSNYVHGDGKTGDAANYGQFKMNADQIRRAGYNGNLDDLNKDPALATKVALDSMKILKEDKFIAFHRGGAEGLNGAIDPTDYKQVFESTKQIYANNTALQTNDERVKEYIKPI